MKTLRSVLESKGGEIYSVAPTASVFDALEEMSKRDVGALIVLDGGEVVGIFSERDYARKIILEGRSSRETPVKDVMTRNVLCVDPDKTVEDIVKEAIARIGENISIRRFARFAVGEGMEKKTSNLAEEVAEQLGK